MIDGDQASRTVQIDAELTATCEGEPAMRILSEGDGVIRVDIESSAVNRMGRLDWNETSQTLKKIVAHTGQDLEISVDGTASLRLSQTRAEAGQTNAKWKVLKTTSLIKLAVKRLGRFISG